LEEILPGNKKDGDSSLFGHMWFVLSGKLDLSKKYRKRNVFGRSVINEVVVLDIGSGEMICEQPLFNLFP